MSNGTPGATRPDRLIALSDGIFAIAMTLLALDIRVPAGLDDEGFHDALVEALPDLAAYVLSFIILATFWRDQRQILLQSGRVGGLPLHLGLAALGMIALLPFPTAMLAEYGSQPVAVAAYAATISIIDLLQLAMFLAIRRRATAAPLPVPVSANRIVVADLGAPVVVFGATVPLAFVSPTAAIWTWLVLLPIKAVLGRRERARVLDG